jgi:hypothetical protein
VSSSISPLICSPSCYPVPVQGQVQMDDVKFFFLDNQIFYWSALQESVSARN